MIFLSVVLFMNVFHLLYFMNMLIFLDPPMNYNYLFSHNFFVGDVVHFHLQFIFILIQMFLDFSQVISYYVTRIRHFDLNSL